MGPIITMTLDARYVHLLSLMIPAEPTDEAERCEGGAPNCGPVAHHDSEGVPLCDRCWGELARASVPSTDGLELREFVPVEDRGRQPLLERYGFPTGSELRPVRCKDGYWTPWHLAQAALEASAPSALEAVPDFLDPVLAELARATAKFPTWPTDPLHALAVLGEEFGELTQAVLQATYEPHNSTPEDVATEAMQTAAMALRFVMSLGTYRYQRGDQHQQEATSYGQR